MESTATTWALYALARNQRAQRKLREEILSVDTEDPTLDELNALPYLESVIREAMRAHSPVAFTSRMAMADDIIPLSRPYVDGAGRTHESLRYVAPFSSASGCANKAPAAESQSRR